jgi:hypothetical protein
MEVEAHGARSKAFDATLAEETERQDKTKPKLNLKYFF